MDSSKDKNKKEENTQQTTDEKKETKLLTKLKKIFKSKSDENAGDTNKKEKDERKKVLDTWKKYRKKIDDEELELDDYTNCIGDIKLNENNEPTPKKNPTKKQPYETYDENYLCHFLERESTIFGRSKCGNNLQYVVSKINSTSNKKFEKDKKIEYKYIVLTSLDKKNIKKDENQKVDEKFLSNHEDATKAYKTIIRPLLKSLVSNDFNFDKEELKSKLSEVSVPLKEKKSELYKAINNKGLNGEKSELNAYDIYEYYPAKQVLDKIIILRSFDDEDVNNKSFKHKLLPVYKDDFYDWAWVDLLGKDIKDINGKHTIEKNFFVTQELLKSIDTSKIKYDESKIFAIYECVYGLYQNIDFLGNEPNVIFHGAPGTGKTYTINEGLRKLGISDDHICKIQCHLNYNYEDFIEGIKPVGITNQGQVKLETISGQFKNFCIKAKKGLQNIEEDDYYFICDEINRTNVSEMFGETLVMIEKDYRDNINSDNRRELLNSTPLANVIKAKIEELYKNNDKDKLKEYINKNVYELSYRINGKNEYYGKKDTIEKMIEEWDNAKDKAELFNEMNVLFGIPKNIRFIGMMNDVDKSIDSFDLALRRRFKWIRKDFDKDVLSDELYEIADSDSYVDSCIKLNNYISNELMMGKSYEFGHSYFLKIRDLTEKSITKKSKALLFENYLEPILKEYLRSFYDENEIDGKIKTAKSKFGLFEEDTNQESEDISKEE